MDCGSVWNLFFSLDYWMRQERKERNKLLERLKTKMGEMKEKGKGGIVSLNIKKPKRPKIIKERSLSEVLKTAQPQKEKRLDTIKEGKIKWFNNTKGWGFIVDGDGVTYFVHHSELTGSGYTTPLEGDAVLFKAERTAKGMKATNVSKQK